MAAKKMKLKTSAKIAISALILLICTSMILIIARPKKDQGNASGNSTDSSAETNNGNNSNSSTESNTPADGNTEGGDSEAQLIEDQGEIEIIIPDDQESDGF